MVEDVYLAEGHTVAGAGDFLNKFFTYNSIGKMSIPKKGARKIAVGGENYLWLIRRKATRFQTDYGVGHLHVAIELAEEPGTTLLVYTDREHPKDWGTDEVIPVTPSDVSQWILQALKLDWKPQKSCSQLSVSINGDEMRIAK